MSAMSTPDTISPVRVGSLTSDSTSPVTKRARPAVRPPISLSVVLRREEEDAGEAPDQTHRRGDHDRRGHGLAERANGSGLASPTRSRRSA